MLFIPCATPDTSFDAIPAIKIQNYINATEEEQVYAYLKMFYSEEGLHLFSVCFEKEPLSNSRAVLIFEIEFQKFRCEFTPYKAIILSRIETDFFHEIFAEPARGFNGADEQGDYWAVEYTIPFSKLNLPDNFSFTQKNILRANFLKYWVNSPALGSFAPITVLNSPLAINNLQAFTPLPF